MAEGGQEQMEGEPGEHVVEEEVQEHIIAEEKFTEKLEPSHQEMEPRDDQMGPRPWHSIMGAKRGYPEEEDIDDEMEQHYSQQGYRRPIPDGPRKRGRPRKFPPGVPPPDYLARLQAKGIDPQMQEIEYEDEHPQQGARVVGMNSRIMGSVRPAPLLSSGAPPRLSQAAPIRMPSAVGQAAHLAAQRLPSLGGGPPKENKPLKVVTLLPNSRRAGSGPPRPVVSAIRTLGQPPQQKNKIPHLPIEKQAEILVNQAVKQADRLVPGQTVGEFNKLIDMLNGQILTLQEDNKKLNGLYTGLIEFKDNRIKQLESQVEKLQSELATAVKNWQAHMVMHGPIPVDDDNKDNDELLMHRMNHGGRPRLAQAHLEGDQWIVNTGDPNGMQEEIIEEEVDEETFHRMLETGDHQLIVHHELDGEVDERGPDRHHQLA